MRQVALLPAGSHQSPQNLLYIADNKLIFASKLAIYVINPQTFNVEKILSTQSRSVLSISVSPHDTNLVATSGVDGNLCIWNIETEECVMKTSAMVDLLAWDPHDRNNCLVVTRDCGIYSWDVRKAQGGVSRVFSSETCGIPTVARWNPHTINQVAVGCNSGIVILLDTQTRVTSQLVVPERASGVVDMQWDRLSSVYLLVAYQSHISLWDTEGQTEITVFDKQGTGISCIGWMDWTSGNFISANAKTGVMKVWNASQRHALQTIRVYSAGILSMHVHKDGRMFCSAVDGSVLVYNLVKHHLEFCTQPGHTDTIFDCKISPTNANILATCSYDGTVKIWTLDDLVLQKTLHGNDGVIYSDGMRLIASTFTGTLIMWDVEKGLELGRFAHHVKSSICVRWNKFNNSLICSTSTDGYAVVFEINESLLSEAYSQSATLGSRRKNNKPNISTPTFAKRFHHPAPVYGCDWNPVHANCFATGCQDGYIRVFDYSLRDTPIFLLKGHSARVFSVLWSPLLANTLCSGSDDTTVIVVWSDDIEGNTKVIPVVPYLVLHGHKNNVRALLWNHEHEHILTSGSWDTTMRVWNTATGACLQVVYDHVADVYTVASHPNRPFTYVSCSRDTTLRVWELEGVVTRMRIRASLACHVDSLREESQEKPFLTQATDLKVSMSGRASKALMMDCDGIELNKNATTPNLNMARRYQKIYYFFCGANGTAQLWEAIVNFCAKSNGVPTRRQSLTGDIEGASSSKNAVLTEHILEIAKSNAKKMESIKMHTRRGDVSTKVEEQLRKAAIMFAQTGDFRKYCDIMVELNDYPSALAVAPCVSLEFWHQLTTQYAQRLKEDLSENCIPHLLCAGYDIEAVDFYLNRGDVQSAMVVAKMSDERSDLIPRLKSLESADYGAAETHLSPRCRERTVTEVDSSKDMIQRVVRVAVQMKLATGNSISAAAQLVCNGEIRGAIALLSNCGEYDIAYAIARCFNYDTNDLILLMSLKAEALSDFELAIDVLSHLDAEACVRESSLLFARGSCSATVAKVTIDHEVHMKAAVEAEAIGNDEEAIINYILCDAQEKAVQIGLNRMTKMVREPLQLTSNMRRILKTMRNIKANGLEVLMRESYLSHYFWFAAHEALLLGYNDIAWGTLRLLREFVKNRVFAFNSQEVHVQELLMRLYSGDADCILTISAILADAPSLPSGIQQHLSSLRSLLQDAKGANNKSRELPYGNITADIERVMRQISMDMSLPVLPSFGKSVSLTSQVVVQGSILPVANQLLKILTSYVTNRRIQGSPIVLDDLSAYISINEAIMWKKVNPYSPLMNGEFLPIM